MIHSVDICVAELVNKGDDNSAECPRRELLAELDARDMARVLMVTCAVGEGVGFYSSGVELRRYALKRSSAPEPSSHHDVHDMLPTSPATESCATPAPVAPTAATSSQFSLLTSMFT